MTVAMFSAAAAAGAFVLTNTMVAGTPAFNQSGYNINVGPVIGTLTPNTVNGILCRTISRVTTPSLFVSMDAIVAVDFVKRITFKSTDANWNLRTFVMADATFSSPGGQSQWIWDTGQATIPAAFIDGVTYECDIR